MGTQVENLGRRCYSYPFLVIQTRATYRKLSRLPKAMYLVRVPTGISAQIVPL